MSNIEHVCRLNLPFSGKQVMFKSNHIESPLVAHMCGLDRNDFERVVNESLNVPDSDAYIERMEFLKTYNVPNHEPYVVNGNINWIDPETMAFIKYVYVCEPNEVAVANFHFMMKFGLDNTVLANEYEIKNNLDFKKRETLGEFIQWKYEDELHYIPMEIKIP